MEKSKNIYVFLADNYADWELGYLLPSMATPGGLPGTDKKHKSVVFFSLEEDVVVSSGGLRVSVNKKISDVDINDIGGLVLPGGTFWENLKSSQLDELVKVLRKRKISIGAICAATGYLAEQGVLDNIKHTSNALDFVKYVAPSYQGNDNYLNELAVTDDHVCTASGFGAVEFTREMLVELNIYNKTDSDIWYKAFKYGESPY